MPKPFRAYPTESWLLLLLLAMVALLGLASEQFLTLVNLFDLLNASSVNIIFAVGLLAVLIAGGIDISFAVAASVVQYLTALALDALGGGNWALGLAVAAGRCPGDRIRSLPAQAGAAGMHQAAIKRRSSARMAARLRHPPQVGRGAVRSRRPARHAPLEPASESHGAERIRHSPCGCARVMLRPHKGAFETVRIPGHGTAPPTGRVRTGPSFSTFPPRSDANCSTSKSEYLDVKSESSR